MSKKNDGPPDKIEFPQSNSSGKDSVASYDKSKFYNVYDLAEPQPSFGQRVKNFPINSPVTFIFLVFFSICYGTYEVNPGYYKRLAKTPQAKKIIGLYIDKVQPHVEQAREAASTTPEVVEETKPVVTQTKKVSQWSIYVESEPEGAEIFINGVSTKMFTPNQVDLAEERNFELSVMADSYQPFSVMLDTRKHFIKIKLRDGSYEAQ
ncbi:MAG: PEGA domain-containing protein [Bdellovibrionota bacterium]